MSGSHEYVRYEVIYDEREEKHSSNIPSEDFDEPHVLQTILRVTPENLYRPNYCALGYATTADLRRYLWEEKQRNELIREMGERQSEIFVDFADRTKRSASMSDFSRLRGILEASKTKGTAQSYAQPGGFRREFLGLAPNFKSIVENIANESPPSCLDAMAEEVEILYTKRAAIRKNDFELFKDIPSNIFLRASKRKSGSSTLQGLLKFLQGSISCAFIFLPYPFFQGAWIFSMLTLISIALLQSYCYYLLILASNTTGIETYSGLARHIGGEFGELAAAVSLFLSQWGYGVLNIVFLSRQLANLIRFEGSETIFVFASCIILIPLSWTRNMKALGINLLVVHVLAIVGILFLFYTLMDQVVSNGDDLNKEKDTLDPFSAFTIIATTIISFEGTGIVLPLRRSLEKKEKYPLLMLAGMGVILVFLITVTLLGVFAFGDRLNSMMTLNLNGDVGMAANVVLLLNVLLSFPFTMNPAFEFFEDVIILKAQYWVKSAKSALVWSKVLRMVLVLVTSIVAFAVKDAFFCHFINLFAFIGVLPYSFIYPIGFYLLSGEETLHYGTLVSLYSLISFSICVMFLGVFNTLISL